MRKIKHKKLSSTIYLIVCFIFFLWVDLYFSAQLVRQLSHGMKISTPVFALTYVKNYGAAFSILQNSREILIILSVVAITLLFGYVIKHLKSISFKSIFFISLLSAGIAGNLHERIAYGYVRDFFEIRAFNFPVFNISDIFITIGVIALIILILLKKTK